MAKKPRNDDDEPVDRSDWHVNAPKPNLDHAHDYLMASSAKWGNAHNPRDAEAMKGVSEALREGKAPPPPGEATPSQRNASGEASASKDLMEARVAAERGWIKHHETGESRPVASEEEALILIRYARRCQQESRNLDQLPFLLKFEHDEEGASMDKWLGGDKSNQAPKGVGANPHSFKAESYKAPGFAGLNYNNMSVNDD